MKLSVNQQLRASILRSSQFTKHRAFVCSALKMNTPKVYGVGLKVDYVAMVAKYIGYDFVVAPFVPGLTNKTPEYLKKNPNGQYPLLETSEGCVFETIAIIKYMAEQVESPLYPQSVDASSIVRAQVEMWLDWLTGIEEHIFGAIMPMYGFPTTEPEWKKSKEALFKSVQGLEDALNDKTYLVGDQVTLADVAVAGWLSTVYTTLFDPSTQKRFPNCTRFISTLQKNGALKHISFAEHLAPPTKAYQLGDPAPPFVALHQPPPTKYWTMNRTRQAYVDFFINKGHTLVTSSPTVPVNDPTLLFANAGMNQFKSIFLGIVDPNTEMGQLKRACNSQKCIRAGGKHNDLDDVGKDLYHHTFFEMMGNWSFGDYFKKEAIAYAWELLTEVYKLPKERLYASYFEGDKAMGLEADNEAKEIWLQYLPAERVLPFDAKDNFWEMGDTGPCGPCSEIHYDRVGGRDAAPLVNADDPMVVEIWNLVFIQFQREADGSLKSLPSKHVDTGMGLERVVSCLQDIPSNYGADTFQPLFKAIEKVSGGAPYVDVVGDEDKDGRSMAYRVVADHIRTLCFAIADGAGPGPEGRDYVIRRILRRAVRYGSDTLGAPLGFFSKLVDSVVELMGQSYPEIVQKRDHIVNVIATEEALFNKTLKRGIERFKKATKDTPRGGVLKGDEAFVLWDTYGFPLDLTEIMSEEVGLTVDKEGYVAAMNKAKDLSRASRKTSAGNSLQFEAEATSWLSTNNVSVTNDAAKYAQEVISSEVAAILGPDGFVDSTSELASGAACGVVCNSTSFYAEQGGQVADLGTIKGSKGTMTVSDVQVAAGYVLHVGTLTGALSVGDKVELGVDYPRRELLKSNHTYTHVLNYALREVLGDTVEQKGSIVLPDKLRFDFSQNSKVAAKQLVKVEEICEKFVKDSLQIYAQDAPLEKAKAINGLRAVFGETYPDPVRIVSIGTPVQELLDDPDTARPNLSVEFCGGTHLDNTKEAESFALVSEEGIATGIRRIVAVTGKSAKDVHAAGAALSAEITKARSMKGAEQSNSLKELNFKIDNTLVPAKLKEQLKTDLKSLQQQVMEATKAAAANLAASATTTVAEQAKKATDAGQKFAVVQLDAGCDGKVLTKVITTVQADHPVPIMILSKDEAAGKVMVMAGVPDEYKQKLKANDWCKATLALVGGKGGGKDTFAQGTGTHFDRVEVAVDIAENFAEQRVG